ncbi:MAG: hypothetical protein N0E48_12745 [Candidatus Thiodiazotropha endolucinida]|nr:hypothetical protein [Candidatus Thiodiazotropha endolucinida]
MSKHRNENNCHCPKCSKVFVRRGALEHHLAQHENQIGGAAKRPHGDPDQGLDKRRKEELSGATENFYDIEKVSERKIEKFNTTASYYKISVKDLEVKGVPEILKSLKQLFQSILDHIARDIAPQDLIRISMDNPELDYPIVLPFMRRSLLTVDRMLSEIERVLQSFEEFVLDQTFGIEFVHVHMVKGSGHKRKPYVDIERLLGDKRSVIQIQNRDNLCCARALVTAMARVQNHPQWDSIRRGYKIQGELAKELHCKAGVPFEACGIAEIRIFQKALPDFQIHVLSKEHFNSVIYQGPDGGLPIYLYFHNQHFDVITKVTGFLNRSYFCFQCKKGYNTKESHKCNNACHFCKHIHDENREDWKHCKVCNCKFVNQTCYDLHLLETESGKSTCNTYFRCQMCNQLINKTMHKSKHICGEQYCKTCKNYFPEDHLCYMTVPEEVPKQNLKGSKRENPTSYIYFDFECRQDDQIQCEQGYESDAQGKCSNCRKSTCGTYAHVPNLCVTQKICEKCLDTDVTPISICSYCGPNERVFSGPDTTTLFCKWLFSDENVGCTVICHNFKGYDSYPILNYLHENAILPNVIMSGSKYMSVEVPICKLRFIDSLNFIPMALADMPEAFGEKELTKGFFPHLYNRKENQALILDHLPDRSFYNPNGMNPEIRTKFLQWYEQHHNDVFDFQGELLRYCRSDVDILRKCCLKFRSLFLDLTTKDNKCGIDPFKQCITIASACNLVFKKNYLENETIGIIPHHGYRPTDKQSVMAFQWLYFMAYDQKISIQHGRNKGEKQIGPYKVDGYYESGSEQVVMEFQGCFWHGCPSCFSRSTVNQVSKLTMADLYDQTLEKKKYLESEGYTYVCIWECQFKKELESNPAMKEYIQRLDFVEPLEPRDAFYGGRTESFKLYEESCPEKQLRYFDVTSLYPFINKTGKIPLGHPEIITENFDSLEKYEGLIKCKILPPKGLYIPVLPSKCNGKLMFSLCRSCCETYQQTECQHLDDERALMGTWVTDEVKEAISQGYKIMSIYEIWHFSIVSQYDPKSKSGGVFTDYVNTFLKVKQEASGWPDWCVDEDSKKAYIKQYFDKEGILLSYDKIEKNPGLRSIAKLMLNSFWGKFGQRSNLTQTTYTDDPEQFFDLMMSDQQTVTNVRFVSDEAVQMDWNYKDDFVESSSRTNVVIAAYTTAQARLKLFSYLKPLGRRVCYCDTDSIIFTTSPGLWEPQLGDYLGDLTDEEPGNTILKFVTGGPKNYAYTLLKPNKKGKNSICKVRGITLNYKNLLQINFDTVTGMVKGNRENRRIQVVDENKICRSNGDIITKAERKDYKIVFDKRVIKNDYCTHPYGM